MSRFIGLMLLASSPTAVAEMVGSSFCTHGPDTDCYPAGNGWPACCSDKSTCPDEKPGCEENAITVVPEMVGSSYCTHGPDTTCYPAGNGWPACCSDGSTCPDVKPGCDTPEDKENPCFARNTYALGAHGEAIPMASLKSGDFVKDGPNSLTRIIVNQHREATFKSALLKLHHSTGELSLTPDHVLEVNGKFVPARLASTGAKLGESLLLCVTTSVGEVINPLTTSGKILTQDSVLASTYPEWIADHLLNSHFVPLPFSLSNLISYVFPEATQAYYDAFVEPLVTRAHPKHLKAVLPAPLIPATFLVGDFTLAAGFFTFYVASPLTIVTVAVMVVAKVRK
eukprot:CAMPEP_0119346102 /NCGR_PEP_ID=MMETSP1333-20130426/107833_1 /TAXON_ID=418940 /ORGANISM="Scyphosphaera apsteinii, Strain RCC1455" /LENGTH=339 /DNA_ID=CAMNT_0007358601 /DNA_START=146 /DNA_END=1165 /DNA_ORIENTATION=+